jgi:hydroxymethylpyrimidine/phosphomethylpyrimidine kinase
MNACPSIPVALTIAGSDSGGGAGIQADLKTFAALGVHGATAITCITAQNPTKVSSIEPCSLKIIRSQLEAVSDGFKMNAAKTGMLYSPAIVREVIRFFKSHREIPLVIDPVMLATSGRRLLQNEAVKLLKTELFPLAALITPNIPETEFLLSIKIRTPDEMSAAAIALYEEYGCPALVKGGHLKGSKEAADFLFDGHESLKFSVPYIKSGPLHGTGCTYSAAITAGLAKGNDLVEAVRIGKEYITQAIAHQNQVGLRAVLNHG